MLRVARGVDRRQRPSPAEVDGVAVVKDMHPVRGGRLQASVEAVEQAAVNLTGRRDQPLRVDEVPRTALVDVDHRRAKRGRDVSDAAGVVKVDVRDQDGGEVVRAETELGESFEDDRDGALAAGLDEDRVGPGKEVAGGRLLPTAKQRVDFEDAGGNGFRHEGEF